MSVLYKTTTLFQPVSRESDMTLLEGARRMDRESLVKIFDLYSSVLYNYVYRLCNDALKADFIVGDVFAKLLEHLYRQPIPASRKILTDDLAPVEFYNSYAQTDFQR